jgi:hypothetical protein
MGHASKDAQENRSHGGPIVSWFRQPCDGYLKVTSLVQTAARKADDKIIQLASVKTQTSSRSWVGNFTVAELFVWL